jgi:hypothetical protein
MFAAEPRSDRLVLSTCADEKRSRDNVYGGDRCRVACACGLTCSASSARSSADATAAETS